MTLKQLLNDISRLAINQKTINSAYAGGSIYDLNNKTVREYPFVYTSPSGNHVYDKNTTTYQVTLFCIDRLLEDSSNDVDIFSTSIEQLKNLLKGIEGLPSVLSVSDNVTFLNFTDTERMSDRCAGAYCTVDIKTLNDSTCFEE